MKLTLITVAVIASFCKTVELAAQSYYYVEPFKEQEIHLFLRDNSTFSVQDLTGCNQFEFTGIYRRNSDSLFSYLIFDSVKLQNVFANANPNLIFSIKNGDTAWIINSERIFIHQQPFAATSNKNLDLQDIRYNKLKEYYIGLLGERAFLQVFGDGSRKKAKKRLLSCELPDIKLK